MSDILFTIPCFHEVKYYASNVSYCKFVIDKDFNKYHVVHLRDPIRLEDVQHFDTTCHFTKHNSVDELWECVQMLPHTTLYNIDKLSSLGLMLKLSSDLVNSICLMTQANFYYKNLPKPNSCIPFLQSMITVVVNDQDHTFKLLQLNRFQIKNANIMPKIQQKKKLTAQLGIIPSIVKSLIFTKNKKQNDKTIIKCSENCKLVGYSSRFMLSIDELPKAQLFHDVYCTQSTYRLATFENLANLFTEQKYIIDKTISYICNI
ncbi:hypothetical protein HgNV_091 [Homarus gammarus nudivirus]|uniref:Uncharacterized protein n=1 Tax=Homarus gammarus nudivirus TaxID=2509616 RepID=A0A411HBC8_9VIRU|nr:hypothetical protein KM727_gp91 [Homarus gammarus nudivirus]QBB28696.1 hypothetical protein HgNV_091 [Homarus gammarus nudivirus]